LVIGLAAEFEIAAPGLKQVIGSDNCVYGLLGFQIAVQVALAVAQLAVKRWLMVHAYRSFVNKIGFVRSPERELCARADKGLAVQGPVAGARAVCQGLQTVELPCVLHIRAETL